MKQSKTHDGTGQWQLWVPTNKWQKGPERDFVQWVWCHKHRGSQGRHPAFNDIRGTYLTATSSLTAQGCRSLKHMGLHSGGHNQQLPKHTHTHRDGHHTTCLSLWTGKSAGRSTHTWALTKSVLTASSSFWVSSSILLMSSIVSSIHLSIQQNSWRWKLVNILFSCFKKINKH